MLRHLEQLHRVGELLAVLEPVVVGVDKDVPEPRLAFNERVLA